MTGVLQSLDTNSLTIFVCFPQYPLYPSTSESDPRLFPSPVLWTQPDCLSVRLFICTSLHPQSYSVILNQVYRTCFTYVPFHICTFTLDSGTREFLLVLPTLFGSFLKNRFNIVNQSEPKTFYGSSYLLPRILFH